MRVRVNSIYRFTANYFMDRNARLTDGCPLEVGDLVQVINLPGCPSANTMGQCYVRLVGDTSKAFVMISTSSLEKQ
jgi:hypothetical protein